MPGGEFDWIAQLLRPLTRGAPEALDLLDDAAVLPSRPGFDLVVTKDALAAGVHFLEDDPLDLVARKLLRVNLSDLAAKGAEPYGYFLSTAWPTGTDWDAKALFAQGLAEDGETFDLNLFGGDTVSTPGPLTVTATLLGWVPAGQAVLRRGARPGDRLGVSGPIGDGLLGLLSARGELDERFARVANHYRHPQPRLDMIATLRDQASAAADVSDGLLADAGHIATASGCAVSIDLERLPVSREGEIWLSERGDRAEGLSVLVTGGDDYQIVAAFAGEVPDGFTDIGRFEAGDGVSAALGDRNVDPGRLGWTHG